MVDDEIDDTQTSLGALYKKLQLTSDYESELIYKIEFGLNKVWL